MQHKLTVCCVDILNVDFASVEVVIKNYSLTYGVSLHVSLLNMHEVVSFA